MSDTVAAAVEVHPTALVGPEVEMDAGVRVGPYAVLSGRIRVGAGTRIGPHALIEGETEIGRECQIHGHAVLGTAPQDLKYRGEPTRLTMGDRCVVREFSTVNRGTAGGGGHTILGNGVVILIGAHVAHDCALADGVIVSNQVQLAGHVVLEAHAIVGGMTGIHQFCRVGRHAFVGACSAVLQDVAPFIKVQGNRAKPFGLNAVGLRRHGFSREALAAPGRHRRNAAVGLIDDKRRAARRLATLEPVRRRRSGRPDGARVADVGVVDRELGVVALDLRFGPLQPLLEFLVGQPLPCAELQGPLERHAQFGLARPRPRQVRIAPRRAGHFVVGRR